MLTMKLHQQQTRPWLALLSQARALTGMHCHMQLGNAAPIDLVMGR